FDEVENWVEIGNVTLAPQKFRFPENRRNEKDDLNHGTNKRRHVAGARGYDSDTEINQRAIDHNQDQSGNSKKRYYSGPDLEVNHNAKIDDYVVSENDELAPGRPIDVHRIRKL